MDLNNKYGVLEKQKRLLTLLRTFHDFCLRNSIKYSLDWGALLGAVRHKGFIPWDDDIDIVMRRPDFERFWRTYKSERYKLKYREIDGDCMVPFARVYDDQKTTIKTQAPWCKEEVGVWIDIMPADCVLEDVDEFGRFYDKTRSLWLKSGTARTASCSYLWDKPFIYNLKLFVKKILFLNGRRADYYVRKVIERAKVYKWGETRFWGQLTSMGDNIKGHHRIEIFEGCELKPFEDTQLMVMNGYDEYLRDNYHDYMQLPPVEKRVAHYSDRTKFYWK